MDAAIADGTLTKNERETLRRIVLDYGQDPDRVILDAEQKLSDQKIKAETEVIDQNKKNGNDFEKYIVKKFDHKFFTIKNWAGDKFVEGRYAETTQQPDLLMEFKLKGEGHLFAMECKWRERLYRGGVEFATVEQLNRYSKFQKKEKIPVYVAIGLGGEADNPEQLFIVPLTSFESNFISKKDLSQFWKSREKDFFYNLNTEILN